MNQKAKDYIKSNTLDLESNNRMDSTGYVQYAVSEAKAHGAIVIAEDALKQKAIAAFKESCPCWSKFQQDRKCNECTYLKDFCNQLD